MGWFSGKSEQDNGVMRLSMDGAGNITHNDGSLCASHGGGPCRNYRDMLVNHPAWAAGYSSGQR